MKLKQKTFFLSICILLCTFFAANGQTKKFSSVEIKGSQIRSMRSKETGRDYDLYIQPTGDLKSGKKYPVLFVLDGQWDFKLLNSVYGGLHYDKYVPEMIIVGVTYSGENPNFDELRAMDYTPTPETRHKGSGDAAKFLAFFEKRCDSVCREKLQRRSEQTNFNGQLARRFVHALRDAGRAESFLRLRRGESGGDLGHGFFVQTRKAVCRQK